MRILFITHNGHPYGANKSLYSVMKYLNNRHDLLLFTPFKNSFIEDKSINNVNVPFFASIFFIKWNVKYLLYPILMCLNLIVFPYLLVKLWIFRPDVIYSNSSVENMGKILSLFSKAKLIVHVREFGDLDYNFRCIFGPKFKEKLLASADGLIFNSDIVKNTILSSKRQRIPCATIYNGIEHLDFEISQQKNSPSFNVGLVGFIHSEKGQLEAVKYMTDILLDNKRIMLYIIGTGPTQYLNKIKEHIIKYKLEKQVIFKGFIKQPDVVYKDLDISLVFSQNEAFGRVTIESMIRGIPVIAYNGGGTMEIIDDMEDGLLFHTEEQFKFCFNHLHNNKYLYDQIRKNGIEKIKNKFSEKNYVTQIEKFIINIHENSIHLNSRNS